MTCITSLTKERALSRGSCALEKLKSFEFATVLDVGCGDGFHAEYFREQGKKVFTNSLYGGDLPGDYLTLEVPKIDLIWACHVLEHCPNPNLFLTKCFNDLEDGGILAVTVPPLKHEIVGGHVTLWNAGLLLYQLILAGFDCRKSSVKTYGYNISVIVRKKKANLPPLVMDNGDIGTLARFFPLHVVSGFNGQLDEVNW